MARALPTAAVLALAGLALTGCSGTPFGDQLSRSFSSAPAAAPATAPTKPASSPPAQAAKPPGTPGPKPPAVRSPAKAQAQVQAQSPAAVQPAVPAPYRVTIKLPAADPSAPAEVLTRALRAAGLAFEVETIERIPPAADAALTPQRAPVPPPR